MIPSHKIQFTPEQIETITFQTGKILESGQVILGSWTEEFESKYAARCNRQYGTAMSSDTAAFEALLKAIDVEDRVVLYPALGFPSILQSVKNAGAQPWFIDMEWDGHLFADVDMVAEAIADCEDETGAKPAALILMHTGGLIARDSADIVDLCNGMGVKVFEDAAHAFGATLDGNPAGMFGDASAFSLYATKPMHTCEGGIIVTDDQEIADKTKVLRNYGRIANFGRSVVTEHGYSWRMTEWQAMVGCVLLEGIDDDIAQRRQLMLKYDQHFPVLEKLGITKLPLSDGMVPNGYRYILLLPEGSTSEDRTQIKKLVKEDHGIDLPGEVYELPSHKQPIWTQYENVSMPNSEDFCERHFSLPVYRGLNTGARAEHIVNKVAEAIQQVIG